MTTSVRPAADPVEPPKRVREMATQTVRPLKPLPTTDAATRSTAAAATTDPVNDYKNGLTEIGQQMSKVEGKLNRLTNNKPDWPTLSSSIDLLGARQELILAKLDTIRNRQKPNDGPVSNDSDVSDDIDVSTPSDDLWGPVTPDESCYEWPLHSTFFPHFLFLSIFGFFFTIFGFLLNEFEKETCLWWLGGKLGGSKHTGGKRKWNWTEVNTCMKYEKPKAVWDGNHSIMYFI